MTFVNKWIKLILSVLISGGGLYYAFGQVDIHELWIYLKAVNLVWISLATLFIIFSIAVRSVRWKLILEPIESIRFHALFGSTMIGYFGNGVLPFRLGELLRAYSISSKKNIETSVAFGTVLLERTLDMLGLVGMILIFGWFYPFEAGGRNIMISIVIITIIGFGFILNLGRVQSHLFERVKLWPISQKLLVNYILIIFNNLVNGLTAIKTTRHVGKIILHTMFLWVIYYYITYCVILATGIDLNWVDVGVILITTSLAIAIPAAPGGVGTHHAVSVYVLTSYFSVGRVESQVFAVMLHAVGFVPLIIIGFIYFLRSSVQIKDISQKSISE